MSYFYQDYWLTGNEHRRMGTANHLSVPNQAFPANDGYVVIIAPSDEMWKRLVEALDPVALGVEAFRTASERLRLRKDVVESISSVTRRMSKREIQDRLSRAKVNVSIMLGIGEASEHPQFDAVGGIFRFGENGDRYVATPFRLHATPGRMTRGYPGLGEHTAEVLTEAGFSDAEIAELSGERA
jgi:crotonobetainyl-CoA:carnitine CoA-transferase CaiB-like acyl-CoA transferase